MSNDELTRRDFVAMTVAAGIAAAAGTAVSSTGRRDERRNQDARRHLRRGVHSSCHRRAPGVIIWPDAFGLRPSMRDMAKRLAVAGYSVLVPNPFYRVAKSPVYEDASKVDFQRSGQARAADGIDYGRRHGREAMRRRSSPGSTCRKQVDRSKKIGTQGYCMGGALVVRTAAAVPNRIGAGASFHGGGLVTDDPNSPHLLAPKIKAPDVFRHRDQRRHAAARREDEAEGSVRRGQGAGRGRGLLDGAARLVRA